jgi:hypothetical protein
LVVPGLEAGNMLFKQLQYLANSEAAGVVVGASVPVVLTSRADSANPHGVYGGGLSSSPRRIGASPVKDAVFAVTR